MHASLLSLEQAVTALLARIEGPLHIATPLGLGKPNRLVNAVYDHCTAHAERAPFGALDQDHAGKRDRDENHGDEENGLEHGSRYVWREAAPIKRRRLSLLMRGSKRA